MELDNGFKETEASALPAEWDVLELRNVAKFENGKAHENYIVDFGPYIVVNSKFISTLGRVAKYSNEAHFPLLKNDITLVMSDIPNGRALARCYLIERQDAYTLNQRICAIRATDVETRFLFYFLNRNQYFLGFNNGVSQTNLRKDEILACPVAVPPTREEQQAIAEALSDIDALINALDALITKKRHVKQGSMQQLLTGKKRLPGFSGEWEEKSIFDLAEREKERFDDGDWIEAEYLTDSGIRLIQTGNIGEGRFKHKEKKKYISEESFYKLRCKEIVAGDLLVCRLADPAGRGCVLPDIGEKRIITSVDVTIFRPSDLQANPAFLINCFTTSSWYEQVNERCGGTTRTRISRSALGGITLLLPPVKEQTAIAEVLTDMDAEITALEAKRDKTKLIKQGMMQELLTGKTRLI